MLGGDRDHGRVGSRDGVVGGTPLSGETDVFGTDRDGGGRLRTPPTAAELASRRNLIPDGARFLRKHPTTTEHTPTQPTPRGSVI